MKITQPGIRAAINNQLNLPRSGYPFLEARPSKMPIARIQMSSMTTAYLM
jgi:hypothetical protein